MSAIVFFSQLVCLDGFYGDGCLQTCSGNCYLGDVCNKVTGVCPSGCTLGWQGLMCDTGKWKYLFYLCINAIVLLDSLF